MTHRHHESWYKTKLVKEARDAGAYARRIEDQYAVGTLDMVFVVPSKFTIFAEGKRIIGTAFGPSPRQWVEGDRILKAGDDLSSLQIIAAPVMIGWDDKDRMFVHGWAKSIKKDACVRQRDDENYYQTLRRFLG